MTALPALVSTALILGTSVGLTARPGVQAPPGDASVTRVVRAPTPSRGGAWPLMPAPTVAAPFDPPEVHWGSGHRGVDLAARVGQRVRPTLPGLVTYAGRIAGRGVVVVSHGAVRTTYEPVAASVRVGDDVGRDTVLGTVELFGSHCLPGACLHWGAREGERYLDPLTLVDAGPRPVRLLPLE